MYALHLGIKNPGIGDVFYYVSIILLICVLAYFFTKTYAFNKKGQYGHIQSYKKRRIGREEFIIEIIYKDVQYVYLRSGSAMVLLEKEKASETALTEHTQALYFKRVLNRYTKKNEKTEKTGKDNHEEK